MDLLIFTPVSGRMSRNNIPQFIALLQKYLSNLCTCYFAFLDKYTGIAVLLSPTVLENITVKSLLFYFLVIPLYFTCLHELASTLIKCCFLNILLSESS